MDRQENLNGVYDLVTKLCEKFLLSQKAIYPSQNTIKRLRSNAYEILLSKKKSYSDLSLIKDNDDPFCQLLAWELELVMKYDLKEHSRKLKDCVQNIQNVWGEENTYLNNTLLFLIQLRNVPVDTSTDIPTPETSNSMFRYFDNSMFKLPFPMICKDSQFSNSSFYLNRTRHRLTTTNNNEVNFKEKSNCSCMKYSSKSCKIDQNLSTDSSKMEIVQKEDDQENIWDIVARSNFTNLRTWESLGNSSPRKEPPFLTESDSKTCAYAHHLLSIRRAACLETEPTKKILLTFSEFIKDVKYLLVGIPSKTFIFDGHEKFSLSDDIEIEGISSFVLKSYCENLTFCGSCYLSLNKLCSSKHNSGYIFAEFCEGIERYLSYYRTAALSISESSKLLEVHNFTRKLFHHLSILSSVCQVGPSAKKQMIPHGVSLLNYLYDKVLSLTNKDITILFSVFYPCCQVYISRFLQPWIFEGAINDPYKEFFIEKTQRYVSSRNRTYWNGSYTIQNNLVLNFLEDLKHEILACGKAMSLLKICKPNSPLLIYLLKNKPVSLSFHLSSESLVFLEQKTYAYYLEVISECGPKFSISNFIMHNEERNSILLDTIAMKRAATLKRLDLQRLKIVEEENKRKQEEIRILKEQYDIALKNKQIREFEETQREIQINEGFLKLEQLREKLIQLEAVNLIQYYDRLFEESNKRKLNIEKNIAEFKKMNLDYEYPAEKRISEKIHGEYSTEKINNAHISEKIYERASEKMNENSSEKINVECSSSTETFISTVDYLELEEPKDLQEKDDLEIQSGGSLSGVCEESRFKDVERKFNDNTLTNSTHAENINNINISNSLDSLNANVDDQKKKEAEKLRTMALENFAIARKNKEKILNLEMGIDYKQPETVILEEANKNLGLNDLQRNKLKVMSSEFGIDLKLAQGKSTKLLTDLEINRQKMHQSNKCFYEGDTNKSLDNENYVNKNVNVKETIGDSIEINELNDDKQREIKESSNENNLKEDKSVNQKENKVQKEIKINLKLNLNQNECSEPMSIGSTPLDDYPYLKVQSKNNLHLNIESIESDGLPSCSLIPTAKTNVTEEPFNFNSDSEELNKNYIQSPESSNFFNDKSFSKRVSIEEVKNISMNCLKFYLSKSICIPVMTQLKLVNNELLRYFVEDLNYLNHLNSLRNYFFLLNGEFGRNITEGLFEKLYDVNFPTDLINCRTLQNIVYSGLDYSCRFQENSNCLSFKINDLPKRFDLCDPNVLDCLSLTYKVNWPLNILLPTETIRKYDKIFNYLLKLHRVSWVLKKLFQDLKILVKEVGDRKNFLMSSPEYLTIQQFRHVMTHFIQTLQNYVVGEVLQSSWKLFEKDVEAVTNLDQLYIAHTTYIKNILFLCLLNERSEPIREIVQNIFKVIFKFYDFLKMKNWTYEEGVYFHPHFNKLKDIFSNFQDFVQYLFKVCQKVIRSGYQPHLIQFLDSLDINGYYRGKIVM